MTADTNDRDLTLRIARHQRAMALAGIDKTTAEAISRLRRMADDLERDLCRLRAVEADAPADATPESVDREADKRASAHAGRALNELPFMLANMRLDLYGRYAGELAAATATIAACAHDDEVA
jgi:hypothetical protein